MIGHDDGKPVIAGTGGRSSGFDTLEAQQDHALEAHAHDAADHARALERLRRQGELYRRRAALTEKYQADFAALEREFLGDPPIP